MTAGSFEHACCRIARIAGGEAPSTQDAIDRLRCHLSSRLLSCSWAALGSLLTIYALVNACLTAIEAVLGLLSSMSPAINTMNIITSQNSICT